MWCQTRSSRMKLPEVHGVSKNLDHSIQPEKQNIRPLKGNEISQEVKSRNEKKASFHYSSYYSNIRTVKENSWSIKNNTSRFHNPVHSVINPSAEVINRRPTIKNTSFYPDPTYRPPPKPTRIPMSEGPENIDISPEINIDFKENSPFQEGVI